MVVVFSTSASSCGEHCLPLTEQQWAMLCSKATTGHHFNLDQDLPGALQMLVTSGSHSLHPRTTHGAQCKHLLFPSENTYLNCCHHCCLSFTALARFVSHYSAYPLDPDFDLQAPPCHDPSLLWHHAGRSGATSCLFMFALPVVNGSSSTLFTSTLPRHITYYHVVS